MNILFYLQQFPAFGGIENVTATLARSFSEVGHSVIILSHAEKPAAEICASLPDLVRQLKMPDQQHVVSTLNKSFLKETIEKNRVEVVIFQDSYARLDGNLIGTLGSCRLIVCEHSSPHHVFCRANAKTLTFREVLGRIKYPFSHRLITIRQRKRRCFLYNLCDRYVLLSTRFYGEFRNITQLIDTAKLRAIPNPVDPFYENPCPPSVANKENVVLFAATLTPVKGVLRLLSVWKSLFQSFPEWRLLICGDGSQRLEAEEYIVKNSVKQVSLEGYQRTLRPYYERAKILAFTSTREGWGLVLNEAMQHRCIPVAFDSFSSVHDIIDDGANGFIVPAFDERAYQKRLVDLMTGVELCETMSLAAWHTSNKYKAEFVVKYWEKLFEEACCGK